MTSSTLVEAAVSSPDPLNSSSSSDQGCSTTPPAALLPPRPIVLSSTPCTESEFAYSPRGYDEDDEDGLPPCSQMEIRRRRENGEVYWEDEGSPATKAKLQERLAVSRNEDLVRDLPFGK